MEVDSTVPRVVHALRFSLRSPARAISELGGLKVYSDTEGKGRETISDLMKRTGATAAINGDFFPFTGDPLGLMVREGEAISMPRPMRPAFGWGEAFVSTAFASGEIKIAGLGKEIPATGLNQEAGLDDLVVNMSAAAYAVAEKGPARHAVVQIESGSPTPAGEIGGKVISLSSEKKVPIEDGRLVITGTGSKMSFVESLSPGTPVTVSIKIGGFDWKKVRNSVGGGPYLVRDGKASIDWDNAGFDAAFATKRHPRSAAGFTSGGDLWFVAVDGRQPMSDGATLDELAAIMLSLGCVEAINLDGGGSTTMAVGGVVVNRPSEGKQRPVANAVLLFGTAKPAETRPLSLKAPASIVLGETAMLRVFDASGAQVPNVEVLWAAQGKAWVDGGGALRAIGEGDAWVFASVRGQILSASVKVTR